MLKIEWNGEQYWVYLFPIGIHPPSFGQPLKSFRDKNSLINFLRDTLELPPELIDEALQNDSVLLSPEHIGRWPT